MSRTKQEKYSDDKSRKLYVSMKLYYIRFDESIHIERGRVARATEFDHLPLTAVGSNPVQTGRKIFHVCEKAISSGLPLRKVIGSIHVSARA